MLSTGDRVGDWVIEDRLGEGGMGAVFRVHSVMSDRVVAALKILKPTADGEARVRFIREAEALSTLAHPAIVRVMAVGLDPGLGLPYLAMELAHGQTLKERLQRGPLPIAEALSAFAPLASALEHAHAAGIFHRDVKPANIILTPGGGVKLVDFGIAMAQSWEALTAAGHVGTFSYLPPEIFRGEKTDPRVLDVYSFGQCLHETLSGQRPFAVESGLTPAAVAAAVGARKLQHGKLDIGPGFPQALREEIWRATDPDPHVRTTMRSIREVLEPMRELVAGPSPDGPSRAPTDGATGEDHTTRVPDPPGPAYSERPKQDWVVRKKTFRARRRGERALLAVAALAVAGLLAAALLPRGRGSAPADPAAARPDEGRRGQTWANPVDELDYAWVPSGRYPMGCTPGDANCDPAKFPYQDVTIPNGFWMGRTEVPVRAYKRFASATGREMPTAPSFNKAWERDDLPVVNVPWETAGAYCAWAGGRLPTEGEWEWADRGGHADWYYPWGTEEPVCQVGAPNGARFDDEKDCRDQGPEKVAAYAANDFGLYDMAGNVWEWTQDVWQGDPEEGRQRRVLRGGSWVNKPAFLRASIRSRWFEGPESRDFIGLRCVRDAAR